MNQRETPSTGATHGDEIALPDGFSVDQGALFVCAAADAQLQAHPERLIDVLCTAAVAALHVGNETAERLRASAATLGALTAAKRGALLLDLALCASPAAAIDLAVRCGLLKPLLPDIDRLRAMPKGQGRYKDVYTHTLRVLAATPPDPITRVAALLHDIAKPDTLVVEGGSAHFPNHDLLGAERAARRLRSLGFEESFVDAVATLVRLHLRANSYEPGWTDSAVRRLRLDAADHWQRLLDLSYADVTSARSEVVARARRRVEALAEHAATLDRPVDVSPLDGTELMTHFGRGPGRWVGEVKRELIQAVHAGTLAADDHAAAWRVAEAIVAALPADA